jgi:hypothetical protein
MATQDDIIEELERVQFKLVKLWDPVRLRQVRVTQHSPGGATVDLSDRYEVGLTMAIDALTKAAAVLRKLNA